MSSQDITWSVSEFVAVLNQTLAYAYPTVTVSGELANFKVSKNRWVYFDLKDEGATVRFFGTVYMLPGPLEDGMMVAVRGVPRLHPQYGFSVTAQNINPVGEGSIKKAAKLLEAKLAAEGLFDPERKRPVPYPPGHIGLVTSGESAAYRDFLKVLNARWGGLKITHIDVQVQGEAAPAQIVRAVQQFNQMASPPDVLVVTRGGGSAEDLQAFSAEQVTRAVAASRIPTVVAIGHETDISLAELAADQRASTPSNAAELLVPDRRAMLASLRAQRERLAHLADRTVHDSRRALVLHREALDDGIRSLLHQEKQEIALRKQVLTAFDPQAALARGYALVRKGSACVVSGNGIAPGDELNMQLIDARLTTTVKQITMIEENRHG
ncbi:MAG TPA: exodeoxyribonuclease VII large subunit [Candidatus Saccharimonadales bacterium]|nr:exodeoxyribonuclease VII large subunit [Candidatus Saccharimonadales bacterium]